MRYVQLSETLEAPADALPSLDQKAPTLPIALLPANASQRVSSVGHEGLEPSANGLRARTALVA